MDGIAFVQQPRHPAQVPQIVAHRFFQRADLRLRRGQIGVQPGRAGAAIGQGAIQSRIQRRGQRGGILQRGGLLFGLQPALDHGAAGLGGGVPQRVAFGLQPVLGLRRRGQFVAQPRHLEGPGAQGRLAGLPLSQIGLPHRTLCGASFAQQGKGVPQGGGGGGIRIQQRRQHRRPLPARSGQTESAAMQEFEDREFRAQAVQKGAGTGQARGGIRRCAGRGGKPLHQHHAPVRQFGPPGVEGGKAVRADVQDIDRAIGKAGGRRPARRVVQGRHAGRVRRAVRLRSGPAADRMAPRLQPQPVCRLAKAQIGRGVRRAQIHQHPGPQHLDQPEDEGQVPTGDRRIGPRRVGTLLHRPQHRRPPERRGGRRRFPGRPGVCGGRHIRPGQGKSGQIEGRGCGQRTVGRHGQTQSGCPRRCDVHRPRHARQPPGDVARFFSRPPHPCRPHACDPRGGNRSGPGRCRGGAGLLAHRVITALCLVAPASCHPAGRAPADTPGPGIMA